MLRPLFLIPALFFPFSTTYAQSPGDITVVGQTLVSGMMLFLANQDTVMIIDKTEGNPTQIGDHPAWSATWDLSTNTATPIDMETNPFCSSGMHFPNGSFATFGGNGAIGPGGVIGNDPYPDGASAIFDSTYDDYDGSRTVRIYGPCDTENGSPQCAWFDNSTQLSMQKQRWYSTAEALANGSIVLIGGFVNGGYINRNWPNLDPATEGGAAEPTYELWPPGAAGPTNMTFMVTTSGLNSYAHAFLMPDGRMFVQANFSTILWDYDSNVETALPDTPNQTVRVYPASGAVAMLPLTPANNYTPTILLCGGQNSTAIPYDVWGDYANPVLNTFYIPATNDCERITPEPTDGSEPEYVKDDDMLEGRTMGQFIILPDGTLLVINGGLNGTAGYATQTGETLLYGDMPYGMSLAAAPVLTPAIYNPNAPAGSRWSRNGLQASVVPRLYHSSALLIPDGSVMVAGSNPNVDYNDTTFFSTEYRAEYFYPWYWGMTRPVPEGIPTSLSYGGPSFDVTLGPSSYSGDANDAADNTTVVIIRPGFTTHAMNMGQRYLQLNNTYTVSSNGTITLHVSQVPPNPNLVTPGPVLFFVVVSGVPSNGTLILVGNGEIGTQPTSDAVELPPSVKSSTTVTGSASNAPGSSSSSLSTGVIAAIAAGGAIAGAIAGAIIWTLCKRKKRTPTTNLQPPPSSFAKEGYRPSDASYTDSNYGLAAGAGAAGGAELYNTSGGRGYHTPSGSADSTSFIPLQPYSPRTAASAYNLTEEKYYDTPPTGAMQPQTPTGGRYDYEYDRAPPAPLRKY